MSDKPKNANRIPFEQIGDDAIGSWSLPSVAKKNKVVFGAKHNKRGAQRENSGELIEDYKGAVKPKPLTAAELKNLAEAAQKEGFESGYNAGREKGIDDGHTQGKKQGYEKAYNETKKKLLHEIKRLNEIGSALSDPMQDQEKLLENIIVDMAINFSKEIIGTELKNDQKLVLSIVSKAIAALPVGATHITVSVNELDAELIEQHLPSAQRSWHINIDNTITSGGCRVVTSESLVDYTCESRLNKFLMQIREGGERSESAVPPLPEHEIGEVLSPEQSNDGIDSTSEDLDEDPNED